MSLINIGKLLNRKNYYIVPFRQINPLTNTNVLMFYPDYFIKTIEFALDYEQIEPVLGGHS